MPRESTFLGGGEEKQDYQNKYLYLEIYTRNLPRNLHHRNPMMKI